MTAGFTPAAPVGNSCNHLNAGKLAAGGFPSLCENDALLYTFIAFVSLTVTILEASLQNVKRFFLLWLSYACRPTACWYSCTDIPATSQASSTVQHSFFTILPIMEILSSALPSSIKSSIA